LFEKDAKERDFEMVVFENNTLHTKLDNLENVFVHGGKGGQPNNSNGGIALSQDYATSTLMVENNELRKKIM